MAIPLAAIALGSTVLNKLFSHRPEYQLPTSPHFFDKHFENLRALVQQQNSARFGSGVNDIRDSLYNMGLGGNVGALTDQATKLSIASNQAGTEADANLYSGEQAAKRAFESGPQYEAGVNRNRDLYQANVGARQNEMQLLSTLASVYGTSKAGKDSGVNASTFSPNNPILGGGAYTPPTTITSPGGFNPALDNSGNPLWGTGFGLEGPQNLNNGPDYKKILHTLFGL